MVKQNIPIYRKLCMTVEEASEYSMIGEHRLRRIIEDDKSINWVLRVGNRTRIKRAHFEKWVLDQNNL